MTHVIEVTGTEEGLRVVFGHDEPAAPAEVVDGAPASPPDAATFLFGWRWLRDHGEDEASLDPDTLQRRTDTFSIPDDICAEFLEPREDSIDVIWNDGATTTHSWQQLAWCGHMMRSPTRPEPLQIPQHDGIRLWRRPPTFERFTHEAVMADDDDGLAAMLRHVQRYGFAVVDGVPAGNEAFEATVSRISYIRHTVFGGVWELSAELTDHADTAYDTTFLEPHTDGTYSHDAPGLQVFCCQERTGTGGESVVVDGFAAAAELSQADTAVLASVAVAGRYIEPGVHLEAERPALRTDAHHVLRQISINNYDRAPFMLPPNDQERFYEAYGALRTILNDRDRWTSIRLEPGDMLIIDNWRALHGRLEYEGTRRFLGCYLNHEDFESRLRVLGLD